MRNQSPQREHDDDGNLSIAVIIITTEMETLMKTLLGGLKLFKGTGQRHRDLSFKAKPTVPILAILAKTKILRGFAEENYDDVNDSGDLYKFLRKNAVL